MNNDEMETPKATPVSGSSPMAEIIGGMFMCNAMNMKEGRKHAYQNMMFQILQKCKNADEAKSVMADMQEAVSSTVEIIDKMVW